MSDPSKSTSSVRSQINRAEVSPGSNGHPHSPERQPTGSSSSLSFGESPSTVEQAPISAVNMSVAGGASVNINLTSRPVPKVCKIRLVPRVPGEVEVQMREQIPVLSFPHVSEDPFENYFPGNPFALPSGNVDLSVSTNTLQGGYERESYRLQYSVRRGQQFKCSIRIPVKTPSEDVLIVEGPAADSKQKAMDGCALEACRVLDRFGLLRASPHERQRRRRRNFDDDNDEDPSLDRTDARETRKKRKLAKRLFVETRESIEDKIKKINDQIDEIKARFENSMKRTGVENIADGMDPLDSKRIDEMQKVPLDPREISKMKNDLAELEKEKKVLEQVRAATSSSCPLPDDPSQNIELPAAKPEFGAQKKSNGTEAILNLAGAMHENASIMPVAPENLAACSSSSSQYNPVSASRAEPIPEANDLVSSKEAIIDLSDDQEEIDDCQAGPYADREN